MKIVKSLDAALGRGLSKEIFDHLRNYLMCAFLLAVGTHEATHHESMLLGLVSSEYAGFGVIGISIVLILLNLYDGIKKLSVLRHRLSITAILVVIYVIMSIRVVELTLNYRSD